jgi:hypothetical protein
MLNDEIRKKKIQFKKFVNVKKNNNKKNANEI